MLFCAAWLPALAQHDLYTCMATTKEYVVGAKLNPSGLFIRTADGSWRHAGYNHPFMFAADYGSGAVYLAAGNGLIQATERGTKWKIVTGSDVTELRDVSVHENIIYFAHSHGIRVSRDRGEHWQELSGGLRRKYTEAIRADRTRPGVLLGGTEDGLYRSIDDGQSWTLAGAAGFQIMHIEQSPHEPCFWLAATEGGGLFSSRDCGVSFENVGNIGVGRNLYDISFDPTNSQRIAIAGWGVGVAISQDSGRSWKPANTRLPNTNIWSVTFDPDRPGRLYASVHEEAVYMSDDAGANWRKDGLEGSVVYRMRFVPAEIDR
jgi:photosystem II stability/assembly factor-like uncharacterized protein